MGSGGPRGTDVEIRIVSSDSRLCKIKVRWLPTTLLFNRIINCHIEKVGLKTVISNKMISFVGLRLIGINSKFTEFYKISNRSNNLHLLSCGKL